MADIVTVFQVTCNMARVPDLSLVHRRLDRWDPRIEVNLSRRSGSKAWHRPAAEKPWPDSWLAHTRVVVGLLPIARAWTVAVVNNQ